MVLTFGKADLPFVAAYLHDAGFEWNDVAFDAESRTLALKIYRRCVESPERGRLLGIIPVVRLRTVPAVLTVRGVGELSSNFRHEYGREATYTHSLIDLTLIDGVLILDSDGATLRARLDDVASLELRDVGPPSSRPSIMEVFPTKRRFDELVAEVERRRSEAHQRDESASGGDLARAEGSSPSPDGATQALKPSVSDLERVVDRYLAGGQGFWAFNSAFMELWLDAELSDQDAERWDEIYELVYMAGPDPVPADERRYGIIGQAELKERLREFRKGSE